MIGFSKSTEEFEYLDVNVQNTDSFYKEGSRFIFGMNFEVSDIADHVERSVWNLETGIGMLGGIYAIVMATIEFIIGPLISNELTTLIVKDTKAGQALKLDSL